MRKGSGKVAFFLGVLALPLLLGGCYLNLFQTARTLDRGQVLFGLGVGMVGITLGEEQGFFYSPQAQLGIGLADGLQLTLQAGALATLGDSPGIQFAGASGELKFRLFDEPDAFALALGFGGGWGVSYFGWAIHGSVYFDSNAPLLPIYFAWRPFVSFGGADEGAPAGFGSIFAGGLRLAFSESAALLLELDYHSVWQLWSPGMSFLFTF